MEPHSYTQNWVIYLPYCFIFWGDYYYLDRVRYCFFSKAYSIDHDTLIVLQISALWIADMYQAICLEVYEHMLLHPGLLQNGQQRFLLYHHYFNCISVPCPSYKQEHNISVLVGSWLVFSTHHKLVSCHVKWLFLPVVIIFRILVVLINHYMLSKADMTLLC
jgi:hypothetical protein